MLRLADLEVFENYEFAIKELKNLLNEKYKIVNHRFLEKRNPYLSKDDKVTEYVTALLDQGGFVPILQVLSEINKITNFTKCFKHHSIKYVKHRPAPETFFAGIIGLGCNIGVSKMAQIST